MRNAPVPKGMVTAILLGIVVKKECIVNAFNILSTPIRRAKRVLPLVVGEKKFIFLKKRQICQKSIANICFRFVADLLHLAVLPHPA